MNKTKLNVQVKIEVCVCVCIGHKPEQVDDVRLHQVGRLVDRSVGIDQWNNMEISLSIMSTMIIRLYTCSKWLLHTQTHLPKKSVARL